MPPPTSADDGTAPLEHGQAIPPGTWTQTPTAGAQGRKVRCPHCHNPIQLSDGRLDEVLCPACGSSFRVADTRFTDTLSHIRRLGKFQLLERVGVGSFGAVWKARDTELDRVVALKVPNAGLLTSPEGAERFYREARAAAQLRHPGIVPVHEVTPLEGVPAIVSDFIEGLTLRDLVQVRPLTFREAAEMVIQVAEALDYAHTMGLVHRDVKPGNIMMEFPRSQPEEENDAEVGRPLILDFGLALRDEAETTLTLDGQVVGTPAYMSPEQAAGHGHQVDPRSDVYSLGVVLYELLSGELPFRGTKQLILHQVMYEEPRSPRRLNEKIPRDLETICLKALAKSPRRRYATAREMAEDLRCFLTDRPIQARPVHSWERGILWARRQPAVVALLAVSGLAALALTALSVGWAYHLRLQQALRAEQAALAKAQVYYYFNLIGRAQEELQDNNVARAEQLLADCPESLRHWEWHYLKGHLRALELKGHRGAVTGLAFSPDGARLASSSEDRTVNVWDAVTGSLVVCLKGHKDAVLGVAFSPDGTRIATASRDGTVKVWDVATGQAAFTLQGHQGVVWSVGFSPDGKRLASGSADRTVKVWNAMVGQEEFTLRGHTGEVTSVSFSPDGKRLVSGDPVDFVPIDPAGRRVVSPSEVKVWDMQHRREVLSIPAHEGKIRSVSFSPDGKWLASAAEDTTVRIWDAGTGEKIQQLKGHTKGVTSITFSPDGQRLASASTDRTIQLWDVQTGQPVLPLKRGYRVELVGVGPPVQPGEQNGGELIIPIVKDRGGLILPVPYSAHADEISSVAFSPDGHRLASGSKDRTVIIWNGTP